MVTEVLGPREMRAVSTTLMTFRAAGAAEATFTPESAIDKGRVRMKRRKMRNKCIFLLNDQNGESEEGGHGGDKCDE